MEALEFFTNQYAFLTPLLLPWMQKLCHDSAEEQLKVLFETELATPLQLVSCTNFSYRYIRSTIIPRLIQYISRGGGTGKSSEMYLRSKLAIHYSRQIQEKETLQMQQRMQQKNQEQQPMQPLPERALLKALLSTESDQISREDLTKITLNARYFELLLTDILDDLCTAFKVTNILCVEKMGIIQYIRSLIYECEKNIKHSNDEINLNSYSGLISCNLLSILNDEYAAECVCDAEDTNLSNFKVFTDIIIENNLQFPQIKNDKENMEIDIEKLERKLKQQQQQMTSNSNKRGTFSQHSSMGTGDRMLKIPHTPQISAVGPLDTGYRLSSPDPNSDWEDDIDLSNPRQIMRGHDLYLINEDTGTERSTTRTVSFRDNLHNQQNQKSNVPPPPPHPIPLNRAKSQSYDVDKRLHSTEIQPRPQSAHRGSHNFPIKNRQFNTVNPHEPITEETEQIPQWDTSNYQQNPMQIQPNPLRRQQSHPMPMTMSLTSSTSANKTPSPNPYRNDNVPPLPPINILQDHKSLPIGTTVITRNDTGNSVATDKVYDSKRNVNLDTPKSTKFSKIQPPKPTNFKKKDPLQRGLTKTEFFAKYLIDSKIIGQGSFAVVRRCKRVTDDMILAMKIIKKKNIDKDSDMELIRREIQILLVCDHPNIIRVYDWCETNSRLFIVLDFCGGGNVLDRIIQKGSFSEFETAQLIRELAIAIQYYHNKGVVHRDLKPENIMYLDEAYNEMKLIDFGMANTLKNKKGLELSTACGSPLYAAPEILKNEKYGVAVDIWSVGVITYLLLCGFPPFFDTHNIKNVYHMIKKCKYSFPAPFWDNISDKAKDFISHLLVLEVNERYTAEDILNHPWIKKTETKQNEFLYDDLGNTDALPEYDDDDNFSSTDDDDIDSNDDGMHDVDYDEILAKDSEMVIDINVNPLHSPVVSGGLARGYSNVNSNLLQRAQTEQVLKQLPDAEPKNTKKKKKQGSLEIVLKGKHDKDHQRGQSLAYMNQGTIFSAQRDHLQKQKALINKEREELTRETAKITKQRQEILQLMDEHNEYKKIMKNFEREKNIYNQEKEKWIAAKGSVEEEKQRLHKLQQKQTERYEAEFDKFVSETQEQRRELSEEYKRLSDERLQMKQKNEELSTELERLHEERTQFETDRNNSLPADIQKLRKDLENEWLKIAEEQKKIESEQKNNETNSNKLVKMMNTLNSKEKEIERDHKELLEIKGKILELEEEKKKEIELMKSDEYENITKKTVVQQQRALQQLRTELEAEKLVFKQLKLEFYSENLGDDNDPNVSDLDWKRKYLLIKTDFDKYCDEMDEYCDALEAKCKEAEDKYNKLYTTFDEENTQLTQHISKKNAELSIQEERLRELEEAEEMWQHHVKETDALKKELDDKHKKYDRISDEISSLHEQISNYKAQLAHYVEVEAELDELKKQMLLIQEKGGTAGISIIREEMDTDSDTDNEDQTVLNDEPRNKSELKLKEDASILSPKDEEAIQNIKVGDRVELQKGWIGRIQYIGSVPPIKHEVIGLALDEAIPDGHDGKGLFVCKPQHGYFTQRWRIKRVIHISTPRNPGTDALSPMASLHLSPNESQFKTIRIKITDIDQIKNNDDGNLADNEDDDGLILVDYIKRSKEKDKVIKDKNEDKDKAPKIGSHTRQFRYIEPSVPAKLDNEKLGWIFHRLRETPIGPLDQDGNNKIDLDEFVRYFLETVNVKDDEIDRNVYEYAFELIDINGDEEITPLEYYRFFDKYRLFPDDHFVNGTVEYKVLAIKSYGLCATPVNSYIFPDDTTVYFHQSQFQYLVPWKKLQERDDTSDEDDDPRVLFKSNNKLHDVLDPVSNRSNTMQLTDDDTESLYDDAEAEQSALRALEKDDESEEEDDDIPVPLQQQITSASTSTESDTNDQPPMSAPKNISNLNSFEGGLYDAYIRSGETPRSPANDEQKKEQLDHPFQQFADPSYSSTTSIPRLTTVTKPDVPNTIPKLDDALSLDDDGKSVADLMKEYSRSNAQLKLEKIGLKMSAEQIEQLQINLKKERELLDEEKSFVFEEKLKIQTLKSILETELMKVGISKTDLNTLTNQKFPGQLSLNSDGHYSVEYEEDTMSLGVPTPHLGHDKWRSAISAIHTVGTTLNFNFDEEQEQHIQTLTDKVKALETLLTFHDIKVPKEEKQEEKETKDNKRAERRALIKTESINAANVDVTQYSFGMQLFFEQYDIDSFNCITFEGFLEALKLLELDDTPENELRAIFYFADKNGNNGLNINEFLYALSVQFLNSILDRKLRLTFGQCDDDFNGALDTEEMRMALDILQVEMSEKHYNLMFAAAQDAGVKGFEDEFDSNMMIAATPVSDDDSDEDESSEEEDLPCCDFVHFKHGLLTSQPFAIGDVELSGMLSDYDQQSPSKYVRSLLSLCWHILVQSFDLMDEDNDGLINSRETANTIEYLGITNKACGDIQSLKGVYKKVCKEKNGGKDKINFKTFTRVMLQQYFRGISDQSIRCVFESHCQGLMTMDQFINSFEAIKNKLPKNRGDNNYKHIKYKQGTNALTKLFKSNDKHNTNTLEWDKYCASIRECIVFHLEPNVVYSQLFKDNWTRYNMKLNNNNTVNKMKKESAINGDIKINLNGGIDCDKLLKNEFDTFESISVQDIIELSDKYHWNIEGFQNNDIFKWWILEQIENKNNKKIGWNTFKKIIYNIWFYSYFELTIKQQFKLNDNDDNKEDEEISFDELQEFINKHHFGLNDALIRCSDKMLKLCYYKVDENNRGSINYNEMIQVLQQVALYSMSEFIFLRYKYHCHGIVDENNNEKYLQKEDFLSISRNNMLIFSNDEERDDIHDTKHLLIKICNSSSLLSGLFDKFAATQYRGDVVKKLNFDHFCTAYLYRLLMELSCFYIQNLCELSFDEECSAEYDDYISVFKTLGFKTEDALFSKSHCDSLAQCMFGTKRLSLSQFYVLLMNKAMINNLELQIYGSFVEYTGDHRDYITSEECVKLVSYLKNNQIIHGKMYSLEKYISNYLAFWNNHYQPIVFNKKEIVIKKRNNNDCSNDNKWYFESFLHCLTFHQFQLNHGRSHLLLKAMNLDRQKMKILKIKEKNIRNERLLLNKEKKLHDLYRTMINSMKKNKSKLIQCKEQILDETNAIKADLNGDDLLSAPNRTSKARTSAVKLAKDRILGRRGSVVVKDDEDTHNLKATHVANQISVELQLQNNNLPQDFNPFGGGNSDSSETDSIDADFQQFDDDDDDDDYNIASRY